MRMEARRDIGDECDGRSHAHGGSDTTESLSIRTDGTAEKDDSDQLIQELSSYEEETPLEGSLLEPRVLCENHRPG